MSGHQLLSPLMIDPEDILNETEATFTKKRVLTNQEDNVNAAHSDASNVVTPQTRSWSERSGISPLADGEVTFVAALKNSEHSSTRVVPPLRTPNSLYGKCFRVTDPEVAPEFIEPYIFTGYRGMGMSFMQCCRSFFYLHNDTVSMWTHLIPGLFYVWCLAEALLTHHKELHSTNNIEPDPTEHWVCPFCIFLLSAALYSLISALAHTFQVMSRYIHHVGFLLDYAAMSFYGHGVGILFYAHSYWTSSTGFQASFLAISACISTLSALLTCATRLLLNHDVVMGQLLRVLALTLPAGFNSLPMLHRIWLCTCGPEVATEAGLPNYQSACEGVAIVSWCAQFAFTFLAALVYVSHWPERWFPGAFDLWGHSHQWLHVFSSIATYIQIQAAKADKRQWGLDSIHRVPKPVQKGYRIRLSSLWPLSSPPPPHELPPAITMAHSSSAMTLLLSVLAVAFVAWRLWTPVDKQHPRPSPARIQPTPAATPRRLTENMEECCE